MGRFSAGWLLAFLFFGFGCGKNSLGANPNSVTIRVSAASSLTEALRDASSTFMKDHPGVKIELNFAASGVLQKQIEEGAPVDIFVSASPKEADSLTQEGLVDPKSRVNIASNNLVLIVPLASQVKEWGDLERALVKKIAISNPATVPSGRYAQQTLEHKNLWQSVNPKLVFGENVRQTLQYVMSGDVDAGVVFSSDALIAKGKVKSVAQSINGVDHKVIVYPMVEVKSSHYKPEDKEYIDFMTGSIGQRILAQFGFKPPPSES